MLAGQIVLASIQPLEMDATWCRTKLGLYGKRAPYDATSLLSEYKESTLWSMLVKSAIAKTRTDRRGEFSFPKVPTGVYAIVCRTHLERSYAIVHWSAEPVGVSDNQTKTVSLDPSEAIITSY